MSFSSMQTQVIKSAQQIKDEQLAEERAKATAARNAERTEVMRKLIDEFKKISTHEASFDDMNYVTVLMPNCKVVIPVDLEREQIRVSYRDTRDGAINKMVLGWYGDKRRIGGGKNGINFTKAAAALKELVEQKEAQTVRENQVKQIKARLVPEQDKWRSYCDVSGAYIKLSFQTADEAKAKQMLDLARSLGLI